MLSDATSVKGVRVIRRLSQVAAWLLLAAIVVLSVVPPSDRPVTPAPHIIEHWSIFFLTGLAFGLGYARAPFRQAAELVAFSAAIELIQLGIPGRHSRFSDFLVDAASAAAGVGLAYPFARRIAPTRRDENGAQARGHATTP